MKLTLDVETIDDIKLNPEDIQACESNITVAEVEVSVVVFRETYSFKFGGDVPESAGFLKFAKFLYSKANWFAQAIRRQKMEGGHIGNSLRALEMDQPLKDEEAPI